MGYIHGFYFTQPSILGRAVLFNICCHLPRKILTEVCIESIRLAANSTYRFFHHSLNSLLRGVYGGCI